MSTVAAAPTSSGLRRIPLRDDGLPRIDVEQPVHRRFEAIAAARPDAIALQTDDARVTYAELNRLASRLARVIDRAAPRRGQRLAMLLDNSPTAIAAMLGALKAGHTYVPLDPAYPRPRTEYILADAQAPVLLTDTQHLATARELAGDRYRLINVDEIPAEAKDFVSSTSGGDAPAYILYTSGSTGEPKGVVQTHRNLLHFIRSYSDSLGITSRDRLTLFYSFSFSASLMDIWGGLLHGATVFPRYLKTAGVADLAEWLAANEISVFHSVPTVFRHFMETLESTGKLPGAGVRVIDLGGEPVYRRDVELFRKHFARGAVLVNHLACTEASVTGQYFIDHDTVVKTANAPAGAAADGVEVLLLDGDGDPVPRGEAGEITVKSRFLSPGYWNKPELTAKAFSDADDESGARLYRTGDIGRLNEDGLIEHLGRKDFRVKIRGLTIEVAEIESALVKAGVKEAAVVARDFAPGDPRLVAYCVPRDSGRIEPAALREAIRKTLPDYMVPACFVGLPALPLTATGKGDRKALLQMPLPAEEPTAGPSEAPCDALEAELLAIWQRLLNVRHISPTDSFFDLGGHSLLAMKMLAQIEASLDQRLSLNLMAQRPTIAGLAHAIRSQTGDTASGGAVLVPIQPNGERPPIFCIAPDHVMHFTLIARRLGEDQPLYGLQPPYPDGFRVEGVTVEHMAERYAAEIQEARPNGLLHLVGFCGGGVIAVEVAQRLRGAGREVGMLALIDTPRSFQGLRAAKVGRPRYYARRVLFHGRVAKGLGAGPGLRYLSGRARSAAGTLFRRYGHAYEDPAGLTRPQQKVLETNRAAFAKYSPKPYDGRLDLFLAGDTFSIYRDDPRLGWEEFAPARTRVYWTPGGHNGILRDPGLEVLIHHLKRILERR